jgi:chromosome segregation ATPase
VQSNSQKDDKIADLQKTVDKDESLIKTDEAKITSLSQKVESQKKELQRVTSEEEQVKSEVKKSKGLLAEADKFKLDKNKKINLLESDINALGVKIQTLNKELKAEQEAKKHLDMQYKIKVQQSRT